MTNLKRNDGRNKDYSISQKLRKTGKSSEEFEIIFNALSLEEVIGLKLELASSSAFNTASLTMFGIEDQIGTP